MKNEAESIKIFHSNFAGTNNLKLSLEHAIALYLERRCYYGYQNKAQENILNEFYGEPFQCSILNGKTLMRNKDKIPVEFLQFNPLIGTRFRVAKLFFGFEVGDIIELVGTDFEECGKGGFQFDVYSGPNGKQMRISLEDPSYPDTVKDSFEFLETLYSDYEQYPESIRQIVINLDFRARRVRRDQAKLIDKNTPHLEILIPKLYKLLGVGYDNAILFRVLCDIGEAALMYIESLMDEISVGSAEEAALKFLGSKKWDHVKKARELKRINRNIVSIAARENTIINPPVGASFVQSLDQGTILTERNCLVEALEGIKALEQLETTQDQEESFLFLLPVMGDLFSKYPEVEIMNKLQNEFSHNVKTSDCLNKIISKNRNQDAVALLSYALIRPLGVWWVCQVIHKLSHNLTESEINRLALAETWATSGDELTRLFANQASLKDDHKSASAWACMAAFWSGDNILSLDDYFMHAPVPPSPDLAGKAMINAVVMCVLSKPEESVVRYEAAAKLGVEIAMKGFKRQ